jgi:multidrug efflux system outer membrane protein
VGTATALVSVYRALGGGWTPPPATATTVGQGPVSR